MEQKIVNLVWKHDLLKLDMLLAQAADEVDHLVKGDVAVVVALN